MTDLRAIKRALISVYDKAGLIELAQFLKSKDRDAISAIYDASVKVMTKDGTVEEKVLQAVVEDAQRSAGVKREFRTADYFDFSFLRKSREQLKVSGWRP